MENHFFKYQQCTLHYRKTGNGPKVLFAFHGFGQDRKVFDHPKQHFDNQYTVYSFDLFFHGKSEWGKNETPLEKTFWRELMQAFLLQEKINRLSLAGFSMGAKFVLAGLEAFPKLTEEVFLIAPDGIKTSFWYSLATYPLMLRSLFKSMISKPSRFYALVHFASSIRLIDKSMLRFVESQMNSETNRNRVYLSWVVFRHLAFDTSTIATMINANKIQTTIVVGRFDKIITVNSMSRLTSKLNNHKMIILETGHNQILSKWLTSGNQ